MNAFKNELIKSYQETPRFKENINKIQAMIFNNKFTCPTLLIGLPLYKGATVLAKSFDALIKQVSVPLIEKIENYYDFINLTHFEKISSLFKNTPKEFESFKKTNKSVIKKIDTEKTIELIENEFIPNFLFCISDIKKCKSNLREDHLRKLYNLNESLQNEILKYNPVISKTTCVDYRNVESNFKDYQLVSECEAQFCVSFYKNNSDKIFKRYFNYKIIFKFEIEKDAFILNDVFFEPMYY